jgi:hypothetical protein
MYRKELAAAEEQGAQAYDAMEGWVSRLGAPEVPGAVLEGYARDLRESRERIKQLVRDQGIRDDLEEALARNAERHRALGLTIRDEVDPQTGEHEDDYA